MLFSFIGLIIAFSATNKVRNHNESEHPLKTYTESFLNFQIDCQALYTFNSVRQQIVYLGALNRSLRRSQWTGNMSILCASTSLMLRTIALWERRRSVVIVLGVLCVAHWALLYRTMFIVLAKWDDTANSCVVTQTSPSWLNTTFFFKTFAPAVHGDDAQGSRNFARLRLQKLRPHAEVRVTTEHITMGEFS
ncbi:hypothetical protein CVT24_004837 [Panaeolus cyanescens]|uniref:Uncharacterized protein n=1 Tax=Panaeolus cyanescens TaxID=181874 RepID=A0A409W1Z7_9AGAR|nr:hypothetical protein CVT24_004837 [Panaeolus cyanescens]